MNQSIVSSNPNLRSEENFRTLYENAPISIWEEDFSAVKNYIDELREQNGVSDFRAYFDEHPEALSQCAELVKVVDVNQATLRLFGAESQDEFYSGISIIFADQSLEAFKDELVALIEGKTRYEGEGTSRKLNGEVIHNQFFVALVQGYEETWSKVIVGIIDISSRVRAEEKLQTSEKRYRTLFLNSPISIWEEDCSELKKYIDGLRMEGVSDFRRYFEENLEAVKHCAGLVKLVAINKATLRLFKAGSLDEFTLGMHSFLIDQSWVTIKEELIALAEGKTSFESEIIVQNLKGEMLSTELFLTIVPGHEDTWAKVFVSDINITERKRAEEKLHFSENRYRALFEECPVPLWVEDYTAIKKRLLELRKSGVTDFKTYFRENPQFVADCLKLLKLVDVNQATLDSSKAETKEALIGRFDELFTSITVEQFSGQLLALAEGESTFVTETEWRDLEGTEKYSIIRLSIFPKSESPEISVLFSSVDITDRKAAEIALQEAEQRLRTLSRRLIEVQEEERRHLARELHDEIGQTLTAIKINLQALPKIDEPLTLSERLEDSINNLDDMLQKVRNLTLDLHPPMLDDLGLKAALRWLVDHEIGRSGIDASFSCSGLDFRPTSQVEIGCFRVAQESLTNVIRHARARSVAVQLEPESNTLHLVVSDDGLGFDVADKFQHAENGRSFGLTGMTERVEMLGGRIEFRSTPGNGTEVHAWFPSASPFPAKHQNHEKNPNSPGG